MQYKAAHKEKTEVMEGFDHSVAELLQRQKISITEIELLTYSAAGSPDSISSSPPLSPSCAGEGLRPNPRINVIELDGLDLPRADIRIVCSKGTYIRALARDIGEALGSGAFLDSLRRTRSGAFTAGDALSIPQALALLN
jgi:tRNA pseudouridine55 synthase